jgi:uncharacterized protein YfaS (alpha-2-macroglobulin family)
MASIRPANQVVEYQINDPRGTKVSEGKATLNSFGSAWGSLELANSCRSANTTFSSGTRAASQHIGSAKLFRLEEYKLPEFKVAVKTPETGRQEERLSGWARKSK